MQENIFQELSNTISQSNMTDIEKNKAKEDLSKIKKDKLNLLITGATGCGKSSTINAMFNGDIAKIGKGVDPETMSITKYELNNLILWDSPGLGDGQEKDEQHTKAIISKLNEWDENGKPLIDLVLVIVDGSSRDLGTSYKLINEVIIPNIGENAKNRVLVAINQADMAMKGRNWDYEKNKPEPKLVEFLDEKIESVKNRIKEATGVDIDPIYYSAGFTEDDEDQRPYNLTKLFHYIVKNTPTKKRMFYANNISEDEKSWTDDDNQKDYRLETKLSIWESFKEAVGGAWDSFKESEIYDEIKSGTKDFVISTLKDLFKKKSYK